MDYQNFDPNVGAPKKGFGAKKILIIIAAVLVVATLAFVIVSTVINNRPMNLIANAFERSVDRAQDGSFASSVGKILGGGSIEISGKLPEDVMAEMFMAEPMDVELSAKLYTDIKNMAFALVTSAKLEGAEIFDASAYVTEESVIVDSKTVFAEAYGVNLETLGDNFDNSVFGPKGAYSLGISFDQIEEVLEAEKDTEKLLKDFEKVVKGVYKATAKSIMENAEVEKVKGSLTFGDKTVKTTDVTITVDEEAFAAIMADIVEFLRSDRTFENFINDYGDEMNVDPSDLYDGLDELADLIEENGDKLPEMKCSLTVNMAGFLQEIVGLDLDIKVDGIKIIDASFTCGPTWKDISEMRLSVKTLEGRNIGFTASYVVNENTKKNYDAGFSVKMEGEKAVEGDITWDKSTGDFKAKLSEPVSAAFRANVEKSGSKTVVVLKSCSFEDEEFDLGGVTITVDTNDKMPEIPTYKNVLTISKDEADAIIKDIELSLEDLSKELEEKLDISFGGYDEDYDF